MCNDRCFQYSGSKKSFVLKIERNSNETKFGEADMHTHAVVFPKASYSFEKESASLTCAVVY